MMDPTRHVRRLGRQEGASAVEFAIIAPVLFMFIFGIIAFGIVLAQNLALENGARVAARVGAVSDATCGDIKAAAASSSDTIAQDGVNAVQVARTDGGADVCSSDAVVPCAGVDPGTSIFITTTATTGFLGIIPGVNLSDSLPLEGKATIECEFS